MATTTVNQDKGTKPINSIFSIADAKDIQFALDEMFRSYILENVEAECVPNHTVVCVYYGLTSLIEMEAPDSPKNNTL